MHVWVSWELRGEVDRVDGTKVMTRFSHVNFLPFAPEGSVVIYSPIEADEPVTIPIPTVTRSVLVGYLSRWGVGAAVVGGIIGAVMAADGAAMPGAVVALVGLGAAVVGWLLANRLAHLSEAEKAQRRVYAAWIGPAVDPHLCGEALDRWLDSVRGFVAARTKEVQAPGYRSAPDTPSAWFGAASVSEDLALLGAAFTLARAEQARTADRAEIRALAEAHRKLWDRLAPRAEEAAEVPGLTLSKAAAPVPGKAVVRLSRFSSRRVWAGVIAAIWVPVLGVGGYFFTHPTLYALDLSDRPGLVLSVDGEPLVPFSLAREGTERRVFLGEHTLEARDAAGGQVVDRTSVKVHLGDRSLVYAPARRAGACVLLHQVVYGTARESARPQLLDPGATSWNLPETVDFPLTEPDSRIVLPSGDSGATRWALRAVKCPSASGDRRP